MHRLFYIGILILPLATLAEEAKTYRWKADDGSVMFSAEPPPEGVAAEEIKIRPAEPIERTVDRQRVIQNSRKISVELEQKFKLRDALKKKLGKAKKDLAQAKKNFVDNEAPRAGEMQKLSGGGGRLTQAYYERRAAEAAEITKLEQEMNEIKKEIKALR